MATINGGVYTHTNGGKRWFQFSYSTSKYSAGVTEITWSFKSCYSGSSSAMSVYVKNLRLSASITSGSLYSGSLPSYSRSNGYVSFYNGQDYPGQLGEPVNVSGTFYVNHNSSGNASVEINITANIYSSNGPGSGSGTISLTGNYSYTACSAPTSISVSRSIGTPGQSITVSWSGAKGGTSNSISSYTIFYRYGTQPTTSAYESYKTVTTTSTSGSTTIPISPTRGAVTYIKIRTNGSAGSSYYSSLSSSASCTTNSLPKAPSVSVNKSVVPSTGETVTFTVTAGSDANSSQSRTLYYSTSSGGTKIKFTSPLSFSIKSAQTLYFYTYDGLEYSSATSKSISVNTKPTVTLSTSSSHEYYYNGSVYTEGYLLRCNSNKSSVTYYYYIVVGGTSTLVGSSTTSSRTIRTYQYVQPGESFYFRVRVNDGIEYSNYVNTSTYTMPATYTSITRHYNQFDSSTIDYSNGDFYRNIRVFLPTDSITKFVDTTVSATYKIGTGTATSVSSISYVTATTADSSYSTSTYYCDITVPASLISGTTYTFTITVKVGNVLTRTYTFTKRRIYSFPGGNINGSLNGGTITNPFTSPPTVSFTIPAPANFINSTEYDYYNFNLSSENLEGAADIRLRLTYGDTYQDYEVGGDYLTLSTPTSDDTVIFNLPGNTWLHLFKNSSIKDDIINALNPITIQASLRITNLFGIVSVYNSFFIINPKENSSITSLTAKLGSTPLSSSSTSIREGQTFNWTYIVEGYNTQSYTAKIQIYRSTNATTPTGGSWSDYKIKEFNSSTTRDTNLLITTTVTDSYTIPQLNQTKYIFFRVQITDSYNQTITSSAVAAGASNRHMSPSITITGYEYTQGSEANTGTISVTYTVNDNGAGRISSSGTNNNLVTLPNSVQIFGANEEDNSKIVSRGGTTMVNTNNGTGTTTAAVENFAESNIQIYLVFKTRLELDSSIATYDKSLESAILTIYNINPTIAIRKQYLGINSTGFDDDRVIVIAAGEKGVRKKMVIETESEDQNTYIDVTTGEMFDFIIDGGTW